MKRRIGKPAKSGGALLAASIARRAVLALASLIMLAGESASAQSFPERPLTLIAPFAAGGATDSIARALADEMGKDLGCMVVVENRTGAAGAIGANAVAKASPNGYTVLMSTTSTHVILPLTQQNLGYDPLKDFAAIGLVARAPNILIVSPKLSVESVLELIAYAKQNPGTLNFASSGRGTITHLIGELFLMRAGIRAQHVPYKSGVQSFAELSSGEVHFLFDSIVWSLPQIRQGKLKGLAVTSAQRSELAPDIPTISEAGLPGFEASTWFGLSAPAGTPEVVMDRLRGALKRALAQPKLTSRFAVLGAEPAFLEGPDFEKLVVDDINKWRSVILKAGLQIQ